MSFMILSVSESYAPPAVAETERPHDRQQQPQNPNRRRHPHRPSEPPSSADEPSPQPASPPTIGTLIDVRASGGADSVRLLTITLTAIAGAPDRVGASL
jgi:hypothetical protein